MGLDFRSNLQPGQICKTLVCYTNENAEIWRSDQSDATGTQGTFFRPIATPSTAYKEARVLHSPKLEAYEEFPIVRAKQRPVILLAADAALINLRPDHMKLDKHLCLVAPCYGIEDGMGIPKIQEPILERIRCLEFPQFFFLSHAAAMEKDSLLRLDSVFHTYRGHLEPTQWQLSSEAWDIIRGQLEYILFGTIREKYKIARQMLQGK